MRDYQKEIDAARDRGTKRVNAEAARNHAKNRAAPKGGKRTKAKKEREQERINAAIAKWNAESAPDGRMLTTPGDLMHRMEALEADLRALPEAKGLFILCETGQNKSSVVSWQVQICLEDLDPDNEVIDPEKDNAIRLFMARRTGVVLEESLKKWLMWDDGDNARNVMLDSGSGPPIMTVVVRSEWGSWDLPEDPDD